MADEWLNLLKGRDLTQAEQAALKRYKKDPLGQSFLPVVDILRTHKFNEESLRLLKKGVKHHPGFTLARIILARELFHGGDLSAAKHLLEYKDEGINQNATAQKLKLRMAALAGDVGLVNDIYGHMVKHKLLDEETRLLVKDIEQDGGVSLKEKVRQQLASLGLDMSKFEGTEVAAELPQNRGSSLDSLTLVNLYASQHNFPAALAMVKRLMRNAPEDARLEKRHKELKKLAGMQVLDESEAREQDASTAEQVEALEVVDRRMKFLQELLQKIE